LKPISQYVSRLISRDIGIDLGTAYTVVYTPEEGIILNEPSIVALRDQQDNNTQAIQAIGTEAKEMLGRTPRSIRVVRPLREGVIADFSVTEYMLKHFIRKAMKGFCMTKPRIIIGVPAGITSVEKRAVREAALAAGAGKVYCIDQPIAAALGAGLPVAEPTGNLILDIGGGTSDIAVISFGGLVTFKTLRIAGDKFDEAIIQYMRQKYNVLIGERMAESLKVDIGSAYPDPSLSSTFREVKGRDLITGIPKSVQITAEDIRDSISGHLITITQALKETLEKTPPEISADIVDRGITLAGGGALIKGIDQLIRENTGLPVTIAENPLLTVIHGIREVLITSRKYYSFLSD
jgi:rod shape-determining protein MreB and related proteins